MRTGFGLKGDTVTQSDLDICEILRRIFAFHNPKYPFLTPLQNFKKS